MAGIVANSTAAFGMKEFQWAIKPRPENYRFDFHADGESKGTLTYDGFINDQATLEDHVLLLNVMKNLRAGLMPPAKKSQPPAEEKERITRWINRSVFATDSQTRILVMSQSGVSIAWGITIPFAICLAWTSMPSRNRFFEIGDSEGHHNISHHAGNQPKIQKLSNFAVWYLKQLARFIEKLRDAKDVDDKRHSHTNLPVVLAAGGCGTLMQGRFIKHGQTPMSNLFLGMVGRMGVTSLERFGGLPLGSSRMSDCIR